MSTQQDHAWTDVRVHEEGCYSSRYVTGNFVNDKFLSNLNRFNVTQFRIYVIIKRLVYLLIGANATLKILYGYKISKDSNILTFTLISNILVVSAFNLDIQYVIVDDLGIVADTFNEYDSMSGNLCSFQSTCLDFICFFAYFLSTVALLALVVFVASKMAHF
jgi:hypothetical protein